MGVAVDRERVFNLKTFQEKRQAAEDLVKASAAPVFNPNVEPRERDTPINDSEESEDESSVFPVVRQPTKTKEAELRGSKVFEATSEKEPSMSNTLRNTVKSEQSQVRPGVHTKFDAFRARPKNENKYMQ